jgi:cell division protease FtsH
MTARTAVPGVGAQSEDTQQTVDQEVRRLVVDAHAEVTRMLTEHRDQLRSLAEALLEAETLDAAETYAAAGVPAGPAHPAGVGAGQ